MSTVKSKKLQVGTDATSSNNFTIYQPSTPDGTLRIGVGNADSPTEVGRFNSNGYVATNAPAFSAHGTAGQSLANGVWTKIAFNTELFDTNSNYDTSLYRFTPTVAGYYQINANIFTTANAAGLGFISIYKNGSVYVYGNVIANSNGGYITIHSLVNCNGSTDYIEIYALQNSGVSLTFGSSNAQFQFSGVLVKAV